MCGIVGIVAPGPGEAHRAAVCDMARTLQHRGPDGHGVRVCGSAVLGHTRLSIIDLQGGAQPISNEDRSVWVTFNGEIYNYVELRRELEERGHQFRTSSDTEVIVHAYEEYGPDCVASFNGPFAFAIWDAARRSLFLARDRFGKKPLYYTRVGETFLFASEIKALLRHPRVPKAIDRHGLAQALTFWCTVPPRTAFAGICELAPASWMLVGAGAERTGRYWHLDYNPAPAASEPELAEELRDILVDAVRLRLLRADVPVGAYVSGGIDSSAVAAIVAAEAGAAVKTFSIAFEDPEFDESHHQRAVVQQLQLRRHHETLCRADDIARAFPDVIWHAEQPLVRTAPAPLFLLSRLVREQGYKVVLSGEGADEVLGGYDIFKEAKVRRFCARQPGSRVRPRLYSRLYPYLSSLKGQSPAQLQAFFQTLPEHLGDPLFSHLPRWQMTSGIRMFLSPDVQDELRDYSPMDELRDNLPARFHDWDGLAQSQYLETAHLLPGYILSSQGDRMQMANSVEGRCPFLDPRLAAFAARLPPQLKIRSLTEKYLLKRAVRGLVPDFVRRRPKQPYRTADVPAFFDTQTGQPRHEYVADQLSPRAIGRVGLFRPDAVTKLAERARTGRIRSTRDGMALVAILSTQLLAARFTEGQGNPCT